ncbi:MAG TPA: hypothetical protein VJN18_24430 [Polyangiaceae bacterium]|nr:hypothetical protein [Polyangiaceae bacterium]
MIVSKRSPQMPGMTRVLTRVSRKNLGFLGLFAAAAIATACAGKALDVGSDSPNARSLFGTPLAGTNGDGGAGVTGTGGTAATAPILSDEELANIQWPAAQECEPAPNSPLVGAWKGRLQLRYRQSPDEAVLAIKGLTPEGAPCGTFRVGQGEPLPPPTDPDEIYPATVIPNYAANLIADPWPGYEYQLLEVISEGTRFAFKLSFTEILRPWCEMQPSYPETFSCLPALQLISKKEMTDCTVRGLGPQPTEMPCWKLDYCSKSTCFCYDECDAALNMTAFELHWDGPALEGTINGSTIYDAVIFLDPVP